jgi:hypothetical protein
MATVYNLKRNSRVFFTTNVAAGTGKVNTTGFTAANTQELTVLDGFTFTQTTTAAAITVSEAGSAPSRGQRSFNTALNPVDFSFSTYIRPHLAGGTVDADEGALWNALFGVADENTAGYLTPMAFTALTSATIDTATGIMTVVGTGMTVLTIGTVYTIRGLIGVNANKFNSAISIITSSATGFTAQYLTNPAAAMTSAANWGATGTANFSIASWNPNIAIAADTGVTAAYSEVTPAKSNVNQLLSFGMVIIIDGVCYTIDNCAMDQASVDFGLDGIATVAWTGKGTQLNQLTAVPTLGGTALVPTFTGTLTGTATGKSAVATTRYITNKLSTVGLQANIGGGGTTYQMALTGGSIQIANNINYITPANIGVLNIPIGYYTGTRAITGTLNAYLKTGSLNTAGLLSDILTASTSGATELKYQLNIAIGGSAAATRIETLINGASLQIPTVDASQDIVSTAIQFTAQGTDAVLGAAASYDVSAVNDIRIRYFSN